MRVFTLFTLAIAAASSCLASPAHSSSEHPKRHKPSLNPGIPITKVHGKTKPHSYIIKLKKNADKAKHLAWLKAHTESDPESDVHHDFDSAHFNAFSGTFKGASLTALRASPDVEYIVPDTELSVKTKKTQYDASWGLQRISQKAPLPDSSTANKLNYVYKYDSAAGAKTNIYIVDSGVKTNHVDFGSRASWGPIFGGYAKKDVLGHGTHVAGVAAGNRWGVAKQANIIAVRVLSDNGTGWSSNICAGVSWAVTDANKKKSQGYGAVINLSLGGEVNPALDQCVTNAVNAGVTVVVAAGNDSVDTKDTSPARAPLSITVGSVDMYDGFSYFSNYGPAVDILAPGTDVTSDWIGDSGKVTKQMSGTSMATPHVAGLAAVFLSQKGGKMTPAQVLDKLKQSAIKGVISRVPDQTVNLFLNYVVPK